jgi:hypothetical protein
VGTDPPATVDLPTPPLPDATVMTLVTPLILDFEGGAPLLGITGAGFGSRRGMPWPSATSLHRLD